VVTAEQRRQVVEHLRRGYSVSERRSCRVLRQPRSTQRYAARMRDGEAALQKRITQLAGRWPRYGYRRIWALLRREGWRINVKRVRRLWRVLGLKRPPRRKKPRHPSGMPGSSSNSCVAQPARARDDVWAWDFLFDRTSDGRSLKWLTLVDEYTRECLLLHAARSLTGPDVVRSLKPLIRRRQTPRTIRSDNGPEFIGRAIQEWLSGAQVKTLYVAPASPWENGYAESFHSRLRDEFMDREEFESVPDARMQAAQWRHEYNTQRPHSSLGYQTPKEFATLCACGDSTSLRSAESPQAHSVMR
jgi:putative transposase